MRDEDGFRAFVRTHSPALVHTARLLTGDHQRGEDLVQAALIKLYPRFDRVDAPLAYTRRALLTEHIDQRRRRWWGERPTDTDALPDPTVPSPAAPADDRDELRRLLAELTARERAVVVLRYYCDLSERDTADTLGLPVGTVKSTCARALARLRVQAGVR